MAGCGRGSKGVWSLVPLSTQDLLHDLHHFEFVVLPAELAGKFPSHLHIDLMKRAQGQGVGVRMIHTILTQLRQRGEGGKAEPSA